MPVNKRVVTAGITSETQAVIIAPRSRREAHEHKKALLAAFAFVQWSGVNALSKPLGAIASAVSCY